MSNNNKIFRSLSKAPSWLFTLLSALLILWLTLSPDPLGDDSPRLFPGADKVAHALMFGFLTTMLLLDKTRKQAWQPVRHPFIIFSVAGSTLLGCLIEVLQREMNLGRGFEYTDMAADFAGSIICGAGWWWLVNPWLQDHNHENSI